MNSQEEIEEMSADPSLDSDSDDLDYRLIDIIGLGIPNLPAQFPITSGQTFGDLNDQLNHSMSREGLVALAPEFGPYPFYRYALRHEHISSSLRRLYVVQQNKDTCIVIVRTLEDDIPVLTGLSKGDHQYYLPTLQESISSDIAPFVRSSVKIMDYQGRRDIANDRFDMSNFMSQWAHPTIAFFQYKFKDTSVSETLKFLFTRGEALLQRASRTTTKPLELIHLARASLHLIVSAQELLLQDPDSRGLEYCLDLHQLLDGLEDAINMKSCPGSTLRNLFDKLCGDRIGALAVRKSFQAFSELRLSKNSQRGSFSITTGFDLAKVSLSDTHSKLIPSIQSSKSELGRAPSIFQLPSPSSSALVSPFNRFDLPASSPGTSQKTWRQALANLASLQMLTLTYRMESIHEWGTDLYLADVSLDTRSLGQSSWCKTKAEAKEEAAQLALQELSRQGYRI